MSDRLAGVQVRDGDVTGRHRTSKKGTTMHTDRPLTSRLLRAAAGTTIAFGILAITDVAPAQAAAPATALPTQLTPTQVGCLPILCDPDDGDLIDLDVDLDLDLDLLGGSAEPAPTAPPAPAGGSGTGDIGNVVDLDVDLGLDARVGDVARVGATVPVDADVSSSRSQPVAVDVDTSPDADVRIGTGSTSAPILDVVVEGVDVGLDADVPSADRTSGSATADLSDLACLIDVTVIDASHLQCVGGALVAIDGGLAGVAVDVGICNVSVAILDDARTSACTADPGGEDPDGENPGGENPGGENPDGDGSGGNGSDDVASAGPGGGGPDSADVSGIRRPSGESLPLTGGSVRDALLAAAAVTAAGLGTLSVRRRHATV